MLEELSDKDIFYQHERGRVIEKLNISEKHPASARAKITNANLEGIYFRIVNDKLRDENVQINLLVTDLYCEVMRLREICRMTVWEQDYKIAEKWRERAM